eukprot:TRINITY_DN15790_c0_g1_i2.p1 TRINITY_DN15790_c0_g1~~TRINITY_DN15790_c0_g1_i2.p1  ORF type:complete len:165 (-),score=51.88 TRINITY_DN15790_c0_g1_i2:425-919(-)
MCIRDSAHAVLTPELRMGCTCSEVNSHPDNDLIDCGVARSEEEEAALLARVRELFDPCWKEVYNHIDQDKDGFLTLDEITNAMAVRDLRPKEEIMKDAEMCMKEYDINCDKKISRKEWGKVEEHFFLEVWDWVRDINDDEVITRELGRYVMKVKQSFGMQAEDC